MHDIVDEHPCFIIRKDFVGIEGDLVQHLLWDFIRIAIFFMVSLKNRWGQCMINHIAFRIRTCILMFVELRRVEECTLAV